MLRRDVAPFSGIGDEVVELPGDGIRIAGRCNAYELVVSANQRSTAPAHAVCCRMHRVSPAGQMSPGGATGNLVDLASVPVRAGARMFGARDVQERRQKVHYRHEGAADATAPDRSRVIDERGRAQPAFCERALLAPEGRRRRLAESDAMVDV